MPLLHGFGDRPGTCLTPQWRTPSICLSHGTIWFRLAGIGDANSNLPCRGTTIAREHSFEIRDR
jgi:hypothetical protein